jgi:protein-L-isoaspartate(D-aspartate) O-methyltransferase
MRMLVCALVIVLLVSVTNLSAVAQGRVQFEQLRHRLVDELLVPSGLKNPRVIKAMKDTPRHEFVEVKDREKAYLDMSLAIGGQQTISSPLIVSQMTEALDPQPGDKVLEIGTGSGYQAAVLSPLVKDVYSIEIVKSLSETATRTLKRLGYKNVHTLYGDGYKGWPEFAPFNKIIVTCSPEKVPQPLVEQLAEGGLMIVPVGERYSQTLYKMRKKDGKLESEALLPTLFVPMTGKAEEIRENQPDPTNPSVVNGSFEQDASKFKDGAQPAWYYERQVAWKGDAKAPDGQHYVEFKNSETGLGSHLLQGFAIDGRKVPMLEVKGMVKTENVVAGSQRDQNAYIALTLYDEQRRQLEPLLIGPFSGTSDWHEESKRFRIPPEAREGILRVGLFGATGTAAFDKLEMKKVTKP